jgi:hypothetical protein
MDEVYRIALRSLEDSFEREITNLNRFYPMDYNQRNDYYHLESEARYRYEKAKSRLYDDFRNVAQRYMYQMANQGYGCRRLGRYEFDYYTPAMFGGGMPYTYTYQFANTKETTKVPTETKKFIILDSSDNPATYFPVNEEDDDKFEPFKTLAEAEKEAQELARQNPTEEFTIYQTVKKYKVAGTPLDTTVFV